jgi:SAM-dependent methyltransferase
VLVADPGWSSQSLGAALDVIRLAQTSDTPAPTPELERAIDVVVAATAKTYSSRSGTYTARRGCRTSQWEEDLTQMLLADVRGNIAAHHAPEPESGRWCLLDVGAGSGRDLLRLSEEPDVLTVALENAPGLLGHLRDLAIQRGLPAASVVAGEMRNLSMFPDASFHCVRSHATLHHLPVISLGVGADLAVAESRRVLVTGGVFYVLVRAGDGVEVIDTQEGLGGRIFQLFSVQLLTTVLCRHGFDITHLEERESPPRHGRLNNWLFCLATAR